MSLPVALMGVALIVTFAFGALGSTLSHLGMSNRMVEMARARNLAESALSQAIYCVSDDPAYGVGGPENATIEVKSSANEGARGWATFSPDVARARSIGWSTNNMRKTATGTGYAGRSVPPDGAHLVGTGRSNGIEVRVEAVVYVPAFPYVIASSGAVSGTGLIVGSVSALTDLARGIDPDDLLPGGLASNSENSAAVHLGEGSRVSGDVVAVGGITLAGDAVVSGEQKPGSAPLSVPSVEMLDLSARSGVITLGSGDVRPILSGFVSAPGSYTADDGLTLDGAVLVVDGDLVVNGPVKGTGAIFVRGSTRITAGGSQLRTDDVVALVSKGDVTIGGAGKAESHFIGIVYTEGNFSASNIALVGAFVANGQQDGATQVGSRMTFTNVAMVQAPVKGVNVVNGAGQTYRVFASAAIAEYDSRGVRTGAQVAFQPADSSGAQWHKYSNRSGSWRRVAGPFSTVEMQVMVAPYLQAAGSELSPVDYARLCGSRPAASSPSSGDSGTVPSDQTYTFDMNPFVSTAGGMKLLLWRDLAQ